MTQDLKIPLDVPLAHGSKSRTGFLANQKELSAYINNLSFLCKRVSRKNTRSFIESQSTTRLDHPTEMARFVGLLGRITVAFLVEHNLGRTNFLEQKIRLDQIRVRKGKIGFSSPLAAWYQYGLKDLVIDTLNSQDFLNSEIWNGHEIRKYTETSLKNGNYDDAIRSWKFIQAHFLMDEFSRLSAEGEGP